MAIVNGYTTLNDVKNALGLGTAALSPDDTEIESVVTAVSRVIDDYAGRFFYSTAGTVLVTAEDYVYLPLPGDWSAITSISIDENNSGTASVVLASPSDYRLVSNKTFVGSPYTAVQMTTYGTKVFPVQITEGVKIIGTRGWSSTPEPVKAAALLQSVRIHSRRAVPFGVAGSPDGGIVRLLSRLDPDVELMLRPYRATPEGI
jgi:hypothetical protein